MRRTRPLGGKTNSWQMHSDTMVEWTSLCPRCPVGICGLVLRVTTYRDLVEILYASQNQAGRVTVDAACSLWFGECRPSHHLHWNSSLRRLVLQSTTPDILPRHCSCRKHGSAGDGHWDYSSFYGMSRTLVSTLCFTLPAAPVRQTSATMFRRNARRVPGDPQRHIARYVGEKYLCFARRQIS